MYLAVRETSPCNRIESVGGRSCEEARLHVEELSRACLSSCKVDHYFSEVATCGDRYRTLPLEVGRLQRALRMSYLLLRIIGLLSLSGRVQTMRFGAVLLSEALLKLRAWFP